MTNKLTHTALCTGTGLLLLSCVFLGGKALAAPTIEEAGLQAQGTVNVSGQGVSGEANVSNRMMVAPGSGPKEWPGGRGEGMEPQRAQNTVGVVTAINGTTITIASKTNGTTMTYTVDASKATVTKAGAQADLSAVAMGQTIAVEGPVTGSAVAALTIRIGMPMGNQGGGRPGWSEGSGGLMGGPMLVGTITAINGSTITIVNKNDVAYTIDASKAGFHKGSATSTLSELAIGDNIMVQGEVTGTSVVATTVMDSGAGAMTNNGAGVQAEQKISVGFFARIVGGIGNFFHHLFGR